MDTFIRQKAEETDRQTNKQTMSTQSNNTKEMTKKCYVMLCYECALTKYPGGLVPGASRC